MTLQVTASLSTFLAVSAGRRAQLKEEDLVGKQIHFHLLSELPNPDDTKPLPSLLCLQELLVTIMTMVVVVVIVRITMRMKMMMMMMMMMVVVVVVVATIIMMEVMFVS